MGKKTILIIGFWINLALLCAGCGNAALQTTPTAPLRDLTPLPLGPTAADAHRVVVEYIAARHPESELRQDMVWREEAISTEGTAGSTVTRFVCGDWEMTISATATLKPIFDVEAKNDARRMYWRGAVTPEGHVTETLFRVEPPGPNVSVTRDKVIQYIATAHPESKLEPEILKRMIWQRTDVPLPETSQKTTQYKLGAWEVTLSYPDVLSPTFDITVTGSSALFQWWGMVDEDGNVQETRVRSRPLEAERARDAALDYLVTNHPEVGLTATEVSQLVWQESQVSPRGLEGDSQFLYTMGDWTVSILCPADANKPLDVVVHHANLGTHWEGAVDREGGIKEISFIPPPVVRDAPAARDAAIDYLITHHADASLEEDLIWSEGITQPASTAGQVAVGFTSGDWAINVQYPPIPRPAYRVSIANESIGVTWQGTVSAEGVITETNYEALPRLTDPASARDQVIMYLSIENPQSGLTREMAQSMVWEEANVTPQDLVGSAIMQYTSGDWLVVVGYPVVLYPTFSVTVTNQAQDFVWEGVVTTIGQVRPGGVSVEPTPTTAARSTTIVDRWRGTIHYLCRLAEFDNYFEREDGERYGIVGVSQDTEFLVMQYGCQGTAVEVWGRLTSAPDYRGRQIVVERIQPAALPSGTPERQRPVEGLLGRIYPLGAMAQFDDYFESLVGERYGIAGNTPELEERITALRQSGALVSVWGTLYVDAADYEGRQILVERIDDATGGAPSELVEAWEGYVVYLCPMQQFDDYFERSDGQKYGIIGLTRTIEDRVIRFECAGTRVRIWGVLYPVAVDYAGRQIVVRRIEPVP